MATTMRPTKKFESPIDVGCVVDRADEDLRHHADRDAGDREGDDGAAHGPRRVDVVALPVLGVEEVLVRLAARRAARRRRRSSRMIATANDMCSRSLPKFTDLLPDARQRAAVHELEDRRHEERDDGEQQHRRLRLGARRAERLLLPVEPAHEHREAHDEQDVAEDRTDQRRLHDLLQALAQREEGDDELGEVAERHVQQATDPRARARGQLLGRPAHERGRRDHAERRGAEDHGRARRARTPARSRSG